MSTIYRGLGFCHHDFGFGLGMANEAFCIIASDNAGLGLVKVMTKSHLGRDFTSHVLRRENWYYESMRKYWLVLLLAVAGVFGQPAVVYAGTNDFTITNFAIEYELSRDDVGRSRLVTTETITALFPQIDQNHGIERALPASYDGHSTSLQLQSVTDEAGNSLPYSRTQSGNIFFLRIGDADNYVHGSKTYVIRYSSRDVTKYFADTGRDEFYWDTIGTGWLVPINQLSATLRLDESLASKLSGDVACYQGLSGQAEDCTLAPNKASTQFNVTATNLTPGENVTVALGFEPDTFQPYQKPFIEKAFMWWLLWQLVSGGLAIVTIISLYFRAARRYRPLLGPIVPEFIPPKNTDIQTAALVAGKSTKMFSAQIIDLAVRHFLVVHLVKDKTMFAPAEYELEIVKDIAMLLPEERSFVTTLFSGQTVVGSRLNLKTLKNNTSLTSAFLANRQSLVKSLSSSGGFWEAQESDRAYFKRIAGIFVVLGFMTLSGAFLFVALVSVVIAFTLKTMTQKGIELSRYVQGLKLYIGATEAEQLQMLQSPEGADKVGLVNEGSQKITLYERLLPYAVLLGLEKNWSKALGDMYAQTGEKPGWYDGGSTNAVFNAAAFSSIMSNVNSSMSTYSSSTGYSSSGGSSGSGSSGGGGGGGGGGGW